MQPNSVATGVCCLFSLLFLPRAEPFSTKYLVKDVPDISCVKTFQLIAAMPVATIIISNAASRRSLLWVSSASLLLAWPNILPSSLLLLLLPFSPWLFTALISLLPSHESMKYIFHSFFLLHATYIPYALTNQVIKNPNLKQQTNSANLFEGLLCRDAPTS